MIVIAIGDALNPSYVQCLCQSTDDWIPVSSFTDEDFDSILGSLSDVLCPVVKEVKITEVKAHKVTSNENYRVQRLVEVYNTGIDFNLEDLELSGLLNTNGNTLPSVDISQGTYFVFYDAANSDGDLDGYQETVGSSGVVSCHLCPTGNGQCELDSCGTNDIGNSDYDGFCW